MSTIARSREVPVRTNIASVAREVSSTFDARFLGLAALIPVLEVFRRISFSLPIALSKQASPEACVACLVAGLLIVFTGVFARFARNRCSLSRVWPAAGLACSLTGMFCMLLGTSHLEAIPIALAPCGYLFLGIGIGLILLAWIEALTANGALVNLFYVSLSVLVGNVLIFAVVALDTPMTLWTLLSLCLVISSLALVCVRRGHPSRSAQAEAPGGSKADASLDAPVRADPSCVPPASSATIDAPDAADAPSDERRAIGAVRSSLTAQAMGLALGVFSWGVMAIPPLPYVNDHKAWVYLAGNLIAFGVILTLIYALRDGARYSVIRQKMFFLLPVFAVFMSYFSFIRMLDANGVLKDVLSIGYNMSMAGFFTLFVASSAAQAREKGLAVEAVSAPALIACTLSYGLGAILYDIYGNTAMYFQIVFTTLYILGLAFISSKRASLNDDSLLEERCIATARKFGLSQHEGEILRLTSAGYTPARIAEELTISPETARTHKKRIYAKLDVHSHDELMRLVRTGKR